MAWCVRLKGCGSSVCNVLGQYFVSTVRSRRRDIDLLNTAVYCRTSEYRLVRMARDGA